MIEYDNDFGYGSIGNITTRYYLTKILTGEQAEDYRKKLKKENPLQYEEYMEYERILEEHGKPGNTDKGD